MPARISSREPVIPGRCEASNPESRDSLMCNCTSEVWSFGPSRNDGVQARLTYLLARVGNHPGFATSPFQMNSTSSAPMVAVMKPAP